MSLSVGKKKKHLLIPSGITSNFHSIKRWVRDGHTVNLAIYLWDDVTHHSILDLGRNSECLPRCSSSPPTRRLKHLGAHWHCSSPRSGSSPSRTVSLLPTYIWVPKISSEKNDLSYLKKLVENCSSNTNKFPISHMKKVERLTEVCKRTHGWYCASRVLGGV